MLLLLTSDNLDIVEVLAVAPPQRNLDVLSSIRLPGDVNGGLALEDSALGRLNEGVDGGGDGRGERDGGEEDRRLVEEHFGYYVQCVWV